MDFPSEPRRNIYGPSQVVILINGAAGVSPLVIMDSTETAQFDITEEAIIRDTGGVFFSDTDSILEGLQV